jgi:hypothetical protein
MDEHVCKGKCNCRVPESVWQRLREGLLVDLLLVSLIGALAGMLLSAEALVMACTVAAGVLMVAVVPLLVLEYRADMAWERANPLLEGEDCDG